MGAPLSAPAFFFSDEFCGYCGFVAKMSQLSPTANPITTAVTRMFI
jgi:hypothetical protein